MKQHPRIIAGELFFITDRNTGFWNIYKWVNTLNLRVLQILHFVVLVIVHHFLLLLHQIEDQNEVLAIYSLDAEFTRPFWVFGNRCYDIIEGKDGSTIIACSYRSLSPFKCYPSSFALFSLPLLESSVDTSNKFGLSIMSCRQHGKSYLGVINQAKNSFCSVDIPFTYIANIVSCSLYR